jgi:adenylate cyclase
MATEGFKRKLAAIFSADVAGYSRLMGEDEAATARTLETYRRTISDLILPYRGRGDFPGDNLVSKQSLRWKLKGLNGFPEKNGNEMPKVSA